MMSVNDCILDTVLLNLQPTAPRITGNAVPFVLVFGAFDFALNGLGSDFVLVSATASRSSVARE